MSGLGGDGAFATRLRFVCDIVVEPDAFPDVVDTPALPDAEAGCLTTFLKDGGICEACRLPINNYAQKGVAGPLTRKLPDGFDAVRTGSFDTFAADSFAPILGIRLP